MSSRAILGRRFDLHIGRGPGHIFCSGGQKTPNLTGHAAGIHSWPNRIEEVTSANILFYKLCRKFYATFCEIGQEKFQRDFYPCKISSSTLSEKCRRQKSGTQHPLRSSLDVFGAMEI